MKKFLASYLNILTQNVDSYNNSDIKFTGLNLNKTFKFELKQWILDYLQNKDYVYNNTFMLYTNTFLVISPAYTQNPNQFKISLNKEVRQIDGQLNWRPILSFGSFIDVDLAINTIYNWFINHQ